MRLLMGRMGKKGEMGNREKERRREGKKERRKEGKKERRKDG